MIDTNFEDEDKARGYPDIATRSFLHKIGEAFRGKVYCLVDFDPHGVGILSVYKYGSEALAHENEYLSMPTIEWLGVDSSDILGPWYSKGENAKLPMHSDDRRKAMTMLRKGILEEGGREPMWRRELQVMLMLNGKIELQAMDDGHPMDLVTWLERKMRMS